MAHLPKHQNVQMTEHTWAPHVARVASLDQDTGRLMLPTSTLHCDERGGVKVLHVKSENNCADMPTKSLHKIKFHKFRSDLMGLTVPSWIKAQGG